MENWMKAAVLALAVTLAAESAGARPTGELTARVSYADLDLTTEAGLATLERRIKSAARNVCRDEAGPWSHVTRCRQKAATKARPQIEAAVFAAHQRHGVEMASR